METMGGPRPRAHPVPQRVPHHGRGAGDLQVVRGGRRLAAAVPQLGVHAHGLRWSRRHVDYC